MAIRLLLFVAIMVFLGQGIKVFWPFISQRLSLWQLPESVQNSPFLNEALKLCQDICDEAPTEQKALIDVRTKEVIKQIVAMLTLCDKIDRAVAKTDATIAKHQKQGASKILQSSLQTQMEKVAVLRTKRQELEAGLEKFLVELQNLQLSILDAASSDAGLDNLAAKTMFDRLNESGKVIIRQSQIKKALEHHQKV